MNHLGDITKINGSTAPPVNVIIGGSPCQDLSVAGKRAGLAGERSGLFMEQIRIIKEMRKASERSGANNIKPRYMVWENVPGAFSSNKGQDFKAVLEETIGVVEKVKPDIPIPVGGWHYSGCIVGDGFSVAWRVFDAQFWGVPQRRRRIALVADFGGATAPEILFERDGVPGNPPQSGEQGQAPTGRTETGVGASSPARGAGNIGYAEDLAPTLSATQIDASVIAPSGFSQAAYDKFNADDKTATLKAQGGSYGGGSETLIVDKEPQVVCMATQQGGAEIRTDDKGPTLTAAAGMSGNNQPVYANAEYTVRRLTPLECERLQGFPDNYTLIGAEYIGTDGKKRKVSDSARYKALGNSIALPPWAWVLGRLSIHCSADRTMASLFDGIGGFPLIWETLNGEGTCLWASEIEEFPIAVTKYHFNHH